MKLKILAIVVLAAVGVGAAFVAVGGLPASAADTPEYLTGAATTGDVADDVAATGTVATSASYGLAFGAPAHLAGDDAAAGSTTWPVTDVKVAVGDTVKKGDVLATRRHDGSQAPARRREHGGRHGQDPAPDGERQPFGREDADVTDQIRQAKISVNNAEDAAVRGAQSRATT